MDGRVRATPARTWLDRGSTLNIEYRWAEGKVERLDEFATELVRLKVNVIVTAATPPTMAAKRATSIIPIVFVGSGDPVGAGLVASLARPGGNLTGLSNQSPDAASKPVELLREVVLNLRRLAILSDGSDPVVMREAEQAQAAAVPLPGRRRCRARPGRNVGQDPAAIAYCNFKNIAFEKGSVLVPSH